MRKQNMKGSVEFVSSQLSTVGHGTSLRVVSSWRLPWRKLFSIFKCRSIRDTFWVRDGNFIPLLLSAPGPHLVKDHAGPMHAASVTEFICASIVLFLIPLWKVLIPFCPQSLFLHSFHLLCHRDLWVLWERIWGRYSFFGWVFQGLSRFVCCLAVGLCIFPIYCRKKYLWCWSKALI